MRRFTILLLLLVLAGNCANLRSRMTGEWNGSVFKGRYETTVIDGAGVDAGTWSAGLGR